jgi:hypothetical protein
MEAEPPKMSVQELVYARQVECLPLIFTKICDHTRREVVDDAGIQFREHSVHNEQYLGGQNVMVGGQKQWGGCALLPLTSGPFATQLSKWHTGAVYNIELMCDTLRVC